MNRALTKALSEPGKLLHHLPDIVSVIFVALCAYTLAELTWQLATPPEKTTKPNRVISVKPASNRSHLDEQIRHLSNAHLFGTATSNDVQKPKAAPDTKLNYVLRGVLAATPMNLASAIIAPSKRGEENIYGIGDKIAGNITIKEIHADRVILDRNGRLETLRLPKDTDKNNISIDTEPSSTPDTLRPQSLNQVRSHLLKNPTSFGDYALPVVVKEKGKQIGYRLNFQQKGDILKQAGLQERDIITAVNGLPLDQPQKAMKALQKLATAKQVNITVKRNGVELPLSIQIQ